MEDGKNEEEGGKREKRKRKKMAKNGAKKEPRWITVAQGARKRGRANKGISITSSNAFTGNKPKA